MRNVTLYQIGYLLGVLFVIGGVVWSVFQISKRLFTNQADSKNNIKRGAFVLIGSPVLLAVIWGGSILAFLILLSGRDFVGIAYSKQFLAGDCYPIMYPSGEKPVPDIGRSYLYESEMQPEVVSSFFQNELGAVDEDSFKFSENLWFSRLTTEGNESNYTFNCTSYYGNGFYEQSCIYVRETDMGSTIETTWNILPSEFGGWCN